MVSKQVHTVKSTQANFDAIISRRMTFQLRKNDRNYQIGDLLDIREVDGNSVRTGRKQVAKINHMVSGGSIADGHVLLNIKLVALAITGGKRYVTKTFRRNTD